MNRPPLLAVASLFLAAAHGFAQTLTLKVAGASRTATLHVPSSGLNKPPLVFLLHGLGGDGPGMQSTTQMDPIADRSRQNYKVPALGNSEYRTAGKGIDPGGDFVDKYSDAPLPGFPSITRNYSGDRFASGQFRPDN